MLTQEEVRLLQEENAALQKRIELLQKGKGDGESFIGNINRQTSATDAFGSSLSMANAGLQTIGATLTESLNPKSILDKTAQVEFLTSTLVRQSMGASRIATDDFTQTLIQATEESLKYGVTVEDNLEMMKSINDVMKVNTYLTDEQVTGMGILARNAGVTSGEIAEITKGFSDIGVGTDDAIDNISKMQKQARDYGVNVGEFMKTVGSNMKLLSTYNFKNGIEGFSKMLAKAQALRIDVSSTFALSEKLLDPEQAIETAAGFQMLGGAIGDLGDPFKLLHMAQSDVNGLQDAMLGMAESAVIFDEETGEFDIPVAEMYRLREAAKLAGKSYEEFSQDAIKAKKRTEKLEILDAFGRYDDDTQELIASLAEFDGGELKVKLPGYEDAINVASLGQDEIKALRDLQEENALDDKEIALRSMKALEAMAFANKQAALSGVKVGVNTKGITDALELMEAGGKTANATLSDVFSEENLNPLGESLTDAISKGLENDDANQKVREEFSSLFGEMQRNIISNFQNLSEYTSEDNSLTKPGLLTSLATNIDNLGFTMGELQTLLGGLNGLIPDLINREEESIPNRDDYHLPHTQGNFQQNDTQITPDSTSTTGSLTPEIRNLSELQQPQNQMVSNTQANTTEPLSLQNTPPTESYSENKEIKVSFDFSQGLPITLDGMALNTLSPDQLKKIFQSQEFIDALGRSLNKNTTYTESIFTT